MLLLRFADWPLRTKMAVLLLIASLLPMLAVNWLGMQQFRSRLQRDSGELLKARGDEVVGRIDTLVSDYQRNVARMASSPNVARILEAPASQRDSLRASAHSFLEAWPKSDPNLRGVAVLDARGVVVAATEPALEGKDLSYRPFVAGALRGERTVSDVFMSEAETGRVPTLALIAPIRGPDGEVRGLAALWVKAEVLSNVLRESNGLAGADSFAIVFDRFGIRIAHSNAEELVFRPGVPLGAPTIESLVAEQRFGPDTRRLLQDVRAVSANFRLAGAGPPGGRCSAAMPRATSSGISSWRAIAAACSGRCTTSCRSGWCRPTSRAQRDSSCRWEPRSWCWRWWPARVAPHS